MTVIAWDGKTMAADRMSGTTYIKYGATTKIERVRGHLVGTTGSHAEVMEWRNWFAEGAKPETFQPHWRNTETNPGALVITPDRRIQVYQASPYPFTIDRPFYAAGSGMEVALAVMFLGHDAAHAVSVCNQICAGCGNGIDILTFDEVTHDRPAAEEGHHQLPQEAAV